MFDHHRALSRRLACSAVALVAGASLAHAQTQTSAQTDNESKTGAKETVLEEIVVRALKREQSLQDAPAMVNAFTERDIENIGVKSMRDYASLVPNLYLVETQSSTFAFVNIRGISQFRNTDPSVAVVIDGVLNTSPIGISQELFDVQQIEVLKGPQGALYGRNALGGAIVITTKKPSNEFEGFVRAGAGGGHMGKGQAAVSGPIVEDKLFGRLAFSYYNDDGFRDNITTGTKGDASENLSVRSRLLWEPNDKLSVDMRGSYSYDNANALGFIDVAPIFHETMPGSGQSLGQFLGIFKPGSPQDAAGPVTGGASVCLPGNCAELQVPGKPFNVGNFNSTQVPLQTNLLGIDHRNIYNLSFLIKYDGDAGTWTSVSSYDRLVQFAIGEQPPRTAAAAQKNTQFRVSDALSEEIRYTSPEDQWLRWTAGAYIVQTDTILTTTVQRDKDGRDSLVDLVKRDPFAIAPGRCQGNPFPPGGPNDNQGNCVMGFLGDDSDNLAYAFFAE
ncbi:MAG: TonB-dependent receptor, partial [Alphaproteobacteria bacterium]